MCCCLSIFLGRRPQSPPHWKALTRNNSRGRELSWSLLWLLVSIKFLESDHTLALAQYVLLCFALLQCARVCDCSTPSETRWTVVLDLRPAPFSNWCERLHTLRAYWLSGFVKDGNGISECRASLKKTLPILFPNFFTFWQEKKILLRIQSSV